MLKCSQRSLRMAFFPTSVCGGSYGSRLCCCSRRKEALALSSHREAVLTAEQMGSVITHIVQGRGSPPISHDISSASIQGAPLAAVHSFSRGYPSKVLIPLSTTLSHGSAWMLCLPPVGSGCSRRQGPMGSGLSLL